ncbi:hypothetical protein VIGAN_01412100, partial [Vigna angularis var. angularis]
LEEHWKLGLRGRPGGSNNQKEKGRKEKGKREPEKKEDSTGEGPEREPVVEDQVLEGSLQEMLSRSFPWSKNWRLLMLRSSLLRVS